MKHILIDTSEFTRLQFDFNNTAIIKLKDYIDHGIISLYINDVINGEIINQIAERSSNLKNDITKLSKGNTILKQIRDEKFKKNLELLSSFDFLKNLKEQYNSFLIDYKVKIIDIDKIKIKEIFHDYFNHKPPFGKNAKRKNEFPDAVILKSAEFLQNQTNEKIILISGDNSFKDYCENTTNFILFDRLENLLNSLTLELDKEREKAKKFIALLNKDKLKLESEIENSFTSLNFDLADEDGEVNNVEIVLLEIEEINILEIKNNLGLFLIRVELEYYADVTYIDYANSIYDKEENDYLYTQNTDQRIYSTDVIDIEFNIEFNKNGTEILQITLESIEDISIYVNQEDY